MSRFLTSEITDVTVYRRGAEITRKVRVSVTKGKNSIALALVSPTVDGESVKVNLGGNAVLVSAEYTVDYLHAPDENEKLKALKESKKRTEEKIQRLKDKNETSASELELLDHNCRLGDESNYDASTVEQLVTLYRSSVNSIKREIADNNSELETLVEELTRINNALSGRGVRGTAVGVVNVELFTDADADTDITLTYFDNGASWSGSYDLRAADSESPILLMAKGRVVQNTNEDWNEVFLKLSTGNPTVSGKQPKLQPWYIDFTMSAAAMARRAYAVEAHVARADEDGCPAGIMTCDLDTVATVEETSAAFEFKLPAVYTVRSCADGLGVDIFHEKLDTEYVYYTVPKCECKVYLLARVSGWEKLNIISGKARIFLGNTYIGSTYIDANTTADDLDISFGTVDFITVSRVKGKGMVSKKLFGGNIKKTVEWEITVKNLRSTEIKIEIHDQLPLSANKSIDVTDVETSGAEADEKTGELVWKPTVEAGKTFNAEIRYTVEYPSDKRVVLE